MALTVDVVALTADDVAPDATLVVAGVCAKGDTRTTGLPPTIDTEDVGRFSEVTGRVVTEVVTNWVVEGKVAAMAEGTVVLVGPLATES